MLNLKKRWVTDLQCLCYLMGRQVMYKAVKKSNFMLVFDFILEQLFTSKTYKGVVGRKHRSHHSADTLLKVKFRF